MKEFRQIKKLSIQNDMGGWAYMKTILAKNPLKDKLISQSKIILIFKN